MNKVKLVGAIIVKIILIIFIVVTFNLIMMPKYITENQDGRIVAEMYREKVSPDIVGIGSSVLYSGAIPEMMYKNYGLTAYISASSSQTSWNSYCILKEALRIYNPKLIIFDIGFLTTQEDYAEEVSNRKLFDYMKNTPNKFDGIDRAMASEESEWSYLIPVLRYHERYKDLSVDDFKYAFFKPNVTYSGHIMNLNTSGELPEISVSDDIENIVLNDCNKEYLYKIINLCKDKNVELMLIKTPSYQPKWGEVFEQSIKEVATDNNLQYVNFDDYMDTMGIDWMMDSPDEGRHLNTYGGAKFSLYLGAYLLNEYDLPDRREDADYKKIWDDKVNRFDNDLEKRLLSL